MRALRHILAGLAGIVAMAAFAGSANATLSIKLDDGANPVVEVVDEGDGSGGAQGTVADAFAGTGTVLFAGSLGVWTVNVTTGTDTSASSSQPDIDLNSVNVNGGGAGSLTLWLTQTDFTGDPLTLLGAIGGTTEGTVDVWFFADDTNTPYGTGTLIGHLGSFNGGAFSGSLSGIYSDGSPYSLTIKVVISHTGTNDSTSFDAEYKVPEPATSALFGMGLLGLGAMRRRNKKKLAA